MSYDFTSRIWGVHCPALSSSENATFYPSALWQPNVRDLNPADCGIHNLLTER